MASQNAIALVEKYAFIYRKPYRIQKSTIIEMISYARGFNLNGLGTGKTFCALAAYDILHSRKLINKCLVVATLSNLSFVWAHEIMKCFPHLKFCIMHGTREVRLNALNQDVDLYIINHDGVSIIFDELLEREDIDSIILDELSMYRNGGTNRTKNMRQIAASRRWVWGLTGAPMPRAITDIWGQCSIVKPDVVPKYFTHLRHMLCEPAGPFKWKPKPGAIERAVEMMQPSIRYSLDDVVELPEQVIRYIPVDMGKRQTDIYSAMRLLSVAMIDDHKIDALNAGACLNKLLQIALGWVYDRQGRTARLDNQLRVQTILDYIDQSERQVLVFLPYKHALAGISDALTNEKMDHYVVSGDTPVKQRNEIFFNFQELHAKKIILAHPTCLSHGLTLTAADTIIWGGPITSLDTFSQANARIRRIGQMHKQSVFMIGGTPVEKKLYTLLAENELTQAKFLSLISSED